MLMQFIGITSQHDMVWKESKRIDQDHRQAAANHQDR